MKKYLDTAGSRTFGCPARSVVTIVTVLSQFLLKKLRNLYSFC